jgi:hypothetical protein
MRSLILANALATSTLAIPFTAAPAATDAKPGATEKKKTGPKAGAERVAPIIAGVTADVPMPETKRRGNSSYPFDQLTAAGMSFHVANKTAKQMASIVSAKNRKSVEVVKDANGNPIMKAVPVKDANGAVVGSTPGTDPETRKVAEYFAVDVTETDPNGKGTRVFRRM